MKLVYAILLILLVYLLFPIHCAMSDSLFPDLKYDSAGRGLLVMFNLSIGISLLILAAFLIIEYVEQKSNSK